MAHRRYIYLILLSFLIVLATNNVIRRQNERPHREQQLNKSNYQNCQRDSSITGTTKNHTSGMYLGNECYPEFYDLHSLKEAQELFYGQIVTTPYICKKIKRFGRIGDGGYEVCLDDVFAPKRNNCLVYSFG
ncbi:hypothetical protein LSH36_873g00077 [Paralvinella palmiformis]|uniref:Methyltransferase domain-containing protein n=1 Tax=Paralvinella palmiformis TaxID=53620 RepID=A0AAD9IYY2_9ANNE|nr:hypothetical protein LSH36_873g00077 [Paralvinella palmiformis]